MCYFITSDRVKFGFGPGNKSELLTASWAAHYHAAKRAVATKEPTWVATHLFPDRPSAAMSPIRVIQVSMETGATFDYETWLWTAAKADDQPTTVSEELEHA